MKMEKEMKKLKTSNDIGVNVHELLDAQLAVATNALRTISMRTVELRPPYRSMSMLQLKALATEALGEMARLEK